MAKTLKDITAVICNWRTARMTKGAVTNLQKYYPDFKEIIIADDGSLSETPRAKEAWAKTYRRRAYFKQDRLDLDNSKLRNIQGTNFLEFKDHVGHGLHLDRILPYIKTDLMFTFDSDMRLVGGGLIEEYLEKYNEDQENIYAVGSKIQDNFVGHNGIERQTWMSVNLSLWNMEPLRRYPRLSFTNLYITTNQYGTAAFLCRKLEYDSLHHPRGPYKAIFYPEHDYIPQLWHLRMFPEDKTNNHERYIKWNALIDG